MSFVQVRDHALWVADIHGNEPLRERIRGLAPGERIELEVEGYRSWWEKLPLAGGNAARHGLKSSGEAQARWHALRDERRGGIASIRTCE